MATELERLRLEASEKYKLADAILKQYEGEENIPQEEMDRANSYFDQVEGLKSRVELLQKNEALEKAFNDPANHLPLNGNAGKNGHVDINKEPQDGEAKGFNTLGEQLMSEVKRARTGHADPRQAVAVANHLKSLGLNENVFSDGGALVQTDFANELINPVWNTDDLISRVRQIGISANANGLKIPASDVSARGNGNFLGGIQFFWLEEGGTKTASKPKFRQIVLDLKKLIAVVQATDELLQDATALESIIRQGFDDGFRFMLADAIVNGNGVGKKLGYMNSPALVTVAKEAGQAANTILFENIVNMWSRFWAPSRRNAVWLINQDIEPQLFSMSLAVGTGGVPVYMPANGLADSPFATLMGRPVIPIEQAATLGTTGDITLVDLSQYIAITKGAPRVDQSIHVQFLTDETTFRWVYRCDGQPAWNTPLTPADGGSNTLSPFVALATRA